MEAFTARQVAKGAVCTVKVRVACAGAIRRAGAMQGAIVQAKCVAAIGPCKPKVASTRSIVARAMPCTVARAVDRREAVHTRPAGVAMASAVHARAAACTVARTFAQVASIERAIVSGPQIVACTCPIEASAIPGTRIHAWPYAAVTSAESILT